MLLTFPSLDTLRLAMTSGAVPDTVSRAAARSQIDPSGVVRVETGVTVSKTAQTALKRLGVELDETPLKEPLPDQILCWPQLLPVRSGQPIETSDRDPVLLEIDNPSEVRSIVTEILRLGNDRQAVRWAGDGQQTRAFVRVVGPPYYTLLRAIDQSTNEGGRIRAYAQQGERVWVELGSHHPLAGRLKPPAGKMLLIRPPHEWLLLEEGRFQDVYSQAEFTLPDDAPAWQSVDLPGKFQVPLKLAPSDSPDPAELWVLNEAGIPQLEELVQGADEQLIARLSFAVADSEDAAVETTPRKVVLRARPGKSGPPVLVLDSLPCRPLLKLPNLFVPCTARLHPPLRRDIVKELLADNAADVVWLEPGQDGHFIRRSLPDSAFRPLSDWVEYTLDQSQAPLKEWMESMQFDFEPFLCHEEGNRPQKKREPVPKPEDLIDETSEEEAPLPQEQPVTPKQAPKPRPEESAEVLFKTKPNELRVKLAALEDQFRTLKSPLEAGPEHRETWIRMTQLNALLERYADAAACAGNALWTDGPTPPPAFWEWSQDDPNRRSRTAAVGRIAAADVDELLTQPVASSADANRLASWLIRTLYDGQDQKEVGNRLQPIQQYLERHESQLGVRLLWLAWLAVFRASQHDVLMIARARDRVLERLFEKGLTPELDLPTFLRYTGTALHDRMRVAREHVLNLRKAVIAWLDRTTKAETTKGYSDLMFAWAMARLGEHAEAGRLQSEAEKRLNKNDQIHTALGMAFLYRIDQALQGRAGGQLPNELLAHLQGLDKIKRYTVDLFRERSRILEPMESFDAYRDWKKVPALDRELATMCDVLDREQLQRRLDELLKADVTPREEFLIISTALDLAPRLGETFAGTLIERVDQLLTRSLTPVEQVELFKKALMVAAHFDFPALVQELVTKFRKLLGADLGKDVEVALSSVVQRSFFGLRKLGMRDEIHGLLSELETRVERMQEAARKADAVYSVRAAPVKLLLQLASGWLYFGQEDRAPRAFRAGRELLEEPDFPLNFKAEVACGYLAALGGLPIDVAVGKMIELINSLGDMRGTFTTNEWYLRLYLSVVEAAILALVSEDVALDKAGRRWLDDDEYLVRKRIHADVRNAVSEPV